MPNTNTIKVEAIDLSDSLNAERKYLMKISGHAEWAGPTDFPGHPTKTEHMLDLSGLNIDQIGVIAGFLDAVFNKCELVDLTSAGILKTNELG